MRIRIVFVNGSYYIQRRRRSFFWLIPYWAGILRHSVTRNGYANRPDTEFSSGDWVWCKTPQDYKDFGLAFNSVEAALEFYTSKMVPYHQLQTPIRTLPVWDSEKPEIKYEIEKVTT